MEGGRAKVRNEDRFLLASDVIKAIDKHTREDGTLDDDISCILEEVESVDAKDTNVPGKWIPCSERLPEDGDCRFYMCLVENHIEDFPMMCQFEEENGFGFYKDIYDPISLGFLDTEFDTMEELGYEKVMYWMPLPETYREVTDEENLESRR
jgi:hypothetical protein